MLPMASGRKVMTTQQRPLLLKDYLMDDMSSCSSNGFKSFPRRHCCATSTVRLLLEIDLKSSAQSQPSFQTDPQNDKINNQNPPPPPLHRSRSRAAAACDAVINAVKSLPFHSVKSSASAAAPSVRKGGMLLLPRSLSRRLRKRSFWKKQSKEGKQEKDVRRWRSFRELLEEQPPPSDQTSGTITVSRLSASTRSSESKSDGNSKNNSWGESEFTSSSESSSSNDVVEEKTTNLVNKVSEEVGVEVGEDSVSSVGPTTTTSSSPQNADSKEWMNVKEEKEQFSPVSVLDCPFEDEDDQTSSPFSCSLARMQGTQHKLMKKIRRLESLAQPDQLEPMDLEKRISALMLDSEDKDEAPTMFNQTEEKAGELVKLIRASSAPSSRLVTMKAENLVLDLCQERIVENKDENVVMQEVMKVAGDWINGQSEEMLLGWEVEGGRRVYVNEMDKYSVGWRNVDEEKQEVGLELEVEVWKSLLKELLLDLVI